MLKVPNTAMPTGPEAVPSAEGQSSRERVLSRLSSKGDLPALSLAVSNTVRGSFSETEGLQTMANTILSDVSLTQHILRIANGAAYRRQGTPACTLVSKAVMVIGLSNVRAIALSAALLEKIKDKEQATHLKLEFAKSFLASVMAREMAKGNSRVNGESLSIAALFKDIGRLLIVSHDFEQFKAIRDLAQAEDIPEEIAASRLMGTGFDAIGEIMMREWHLPESIISATRRGSSEASGKGGQSTEDWMRGAVALSTETASALTETAGPERERAFSEALSKHGGGVSVNRGQLDDLLAIAGKESLDLAHGLGLPVLVSDARDAEDEAAAKVAAKELARLAAEGGTGEPDAKEVLLEGAVLTEVTSPEDTLHAATLAPAHQASHAILLAGIHEATRTLISENATLRDVVTLVLEALFRGLHYDRVLICLKNHSKGIYETKAALGKSQASLMAGFALPCEYTDDVFHIALSKNVDVQIKNAREPVIWTRLPNWHHKLLPKTLSFLLLPLVLNGKILGFFYGDRDTEDEHAITKDELDLVKALKNQVLLAVKALR